MAAKKISTFEDAEVGFMDDIPVRQIDGTVTTLGELDPSTGEAGDDAPVSSFKPRASRSKSKTPVNKGKPTGATGKAVKALTTAQAQVKADKKKRENEAKKRLQAKMVSLRSQLVTLGGPEMSDDVTEAGLREAIKDQRATNKLAKEAAKADRATSEEKRAQAKLEAMGFTGDPDADAEYAQILDDSKALAVRPVPAGSVSLGWLEAPGLKLTPTGIVLGEDIGLAGWAKTMHGIAGLGEAARFALGDLLVYGEGHFGQQYKHVAENLGIKVSTLKNAKYVAASIPIGERVEGLPFTSHLAVAWLYRSHPAEARNILERAKYEMRAQPWILEEVKRVRQQLAEGGADLEVAGEEAGTNGTEDGLTPAQRRAERVDALVLATTEQSERDLALKGSPAKIAKAKREELVALVKYAESNDLVPSEAVLRSVARLQAKVDDLEGENKLLRERVAQLEGQLEYRAGANTRIVEGEFTDLVAQPSEGAAADNGELDDLLAYVSDEDEDFEEEGFVADLDDEDEDEGEDDGARLIITGK